MLTNTTNEIEAYRRTQLPKYLMWSQEGADKLSPLMSKRLNSWLEDWQEIADKTHKITLRCLVIDDGTADDAFYWYKHHMNVKFQLFQIISLDNCPAVLTEPMTSASVLLLLGASSNVGRAVAKLFLQSGYQVALPARRLESGRNQDGAFIFKADLATPDFVSDLFVRVEEEIGCPLIAVYNGGISALEWKHNTDYFPP